MFCPRETFPNVGYLSTNTIEMMRKQKQDKAKDNWKVRGVVTFEQALLSASAKSCRIGVVVIFHSSKAEKPQMKNASFVQEAWRFELTTLAPLQERQLFFRFCLNLLAFMADHHLHIFFKNAKIWGSSVPRSFQRIWETAVPHIWEQQKTDAFCIMFLLDKEHTLRIWTLQDCRKCFKNSIVYIVLKNCTPKCKPRWNSQHQNMHSTKKQMKKGARRIGTIRFFWWPSPEQAVSEVIDD